MAACINDVAKHAGVSISTISNTLNGTRYVKPETRERVLKAVEELNYQANPIARSMKSNSTMMIGVILTSINRIFFPPVLTGIQEKAADKGYGTSMFSTNDNLDKEKEYISMLLNYRVDGIVLDSVALEDDKEYFKYLSSLSAGKKRVPVVSIERDMKSFGIPSIFVDNKSGGQKVTEHLMDCGCKKTVYIGGPITSEMTKKRLEGYKAALGAYGIALNESLILSGDFSPVSGYKALKFLLENEVNFDSVFAANDQMAIGALKALHEYRISVPEQVKVAGFDNTFVSSIVSPSLTTVNVPKYRLGTEAVDLLCKLIGGLNNREKPHCDVLYKMLDTSLMIRKSTAIGKESYWELENW